MDKYITFHFDCPDHGGSENDGEKNREKYPLVRKGNILVSLSNENFSEGERKYTLAAGNNTVLEQHCLRATVSGYPVTCSQESESTCLITVSVIPLVTISQDKMFASINLYPPPQDSEPIMTETLLDCLEEEGIIYGFDRYKIEKSLIALNDTGEPILDVIAARGVLPLHGRDASFRFSIDVGPFPGTLQQGGE